MWAWPGSAGRRGQRTRRDDLRTRAEDRTRYAVGEPARGISGFRASHEQALAAHRVSRHLPQLVTRYDDVALEAALLHDLRAARHFVDRELGPLSASDARNRLLLETLGSYLRSGLNAAGTAAVLHVSDRTIAYRIHGIEETLGRSVLSRSSELGAAVRLHRVLNP